MGFAIMAYAGDALREYNLPAVNNQDYELVLESRLFGMRESIRIFMEVLNNSWRFIASDKYHLYKNNGERYGGENLTCGDLFTIELPQGRTISLIVAEYENVRTIMRKYSISETESIQIGSDEYCSLRYTFMKYISRNHALLYRRGNDWYINDNSFNGTFIGGRRITGGQKLNFGDIIDIYGLKIVFLQNLIAVTAYSYKGSSIESSLKEYRQPDKTLYAGKALDLNKKKFYKRSPRSIEQPYSEAVSIEAAPARKKTKQKPMFLTIGPSFTMVIPMLLGSMMTVFGAGSKMGAYIYTGIITALGSAIFGVFWAYNNIKYTNISENEEEQERYNAYGQYLMETTAFLKEKYDYNAAVLNKTNISAAECCLYDENNTQLWNRNASQEDFLAVRLGIGNCPFQVEINIPPEKFTVNKDELADKPQEIKRNFETLYNVPVCIDLLKNNMVGVTGGHNLEGARQAALDMVVQIAVNNCYTDVKMAFIYDEKHDGDFWNFTKWLPHVWTPDKKCRLTAANKQDASDVCYELTKIMRSREENKADASAGDGIKLPHYIIFIESPELLEGELLLKYIMKPKKEYGLTTVFITRQYEQLPNICEEIIQNDETFRGMYNISESRTKMKEIQFDAISVNQAERLARRISGIEVNEEVENGEIPNSLDFFEMYNASSLEDLNVKERWAKNRTYDSMKVIIGKKSGGKDCYLDIHEKYHGPHGLVAGTTGSGKSETLQTYMLSLAVNFSPDDIAFLIIDFKGGGMANLFSNLPHLAGKISNLSGNQVRRAMISINSENRRRQKIFNDNNVNNINLYTRLYKNHEVNIPVPHLFIIIDEFAELKREQPEFMKELISVAQVGRSLGVHLILATQKPNGTVDDNIWSNTKFRLCLRVQDRQDSNEMLHKPDAAYLTQAGRCYLQVGNDELFELFQSGYSGAKYTENMLEKTKTDAVLMTLTGKTALSGNSVRKKIKNEAEAENKGGQNTKEITQLEAVTDYLKKVAEENNYSQRLQLWMPVLPDVICLKDIAEYKPCGYGRRENGKWELKAPVGMYDDPENQSQQAVQIDFSKDGHLAVCGTVSTGKSTFLQTLMYSLMNLYTPEEVNFYALDFSSKMLSSYEGAAHVGGVCYEEDIEKIKKFFNMLSKIMDERRELFKGGNYSQYVRVNGVKLPAVIVVIDNYSGFAEKTGGIFEAAIMRIAKEGVGYGVYLAVSCAGFNSMELPARIADNIRNVITLNMGDVFKYSEVLHVVRVPISPEADIKGRGLCTVNGNILEYQTAVAVEAADDYERQEKIKERMKEIALKWSGTAARKIPEIPAKPVLSEFEQLREYKEMLESDRMLPVGYYAKDASVYGVNIQKTYCYLISGKSRTGKTNMLKCVISAAAKRAQTELVVIDAPDGGLNAAAKKFNARYVTSREDIKKFFTETVDIFKKRNVLKRELYKNGYDDEAVFEKMQQETMYFIFVYDFIDFIKTVYTEAAEIQLAPYLENITEKGYLHNIFFFGCVNPDEAVKAVGYKIYSNIMSYGTGIHFGGYINSQKLFQFTDIPFVQQGKPMKCGTGLIPDDEDASLSQQVVIPLVKGW